MSEIVLSLSIIIILISVGIWKRTPFHPLAVYLFIWGGVMGLWSLDHYFKIINFINPTLEIWGVFLLVHVAFVIGSLTAEIIGSVLKPSTDFHKDSFEIAQRRMLYIAYGLFALSMVGYLGFLNFLFGRINLVSNLTSILKQWNLVTSNANESFTFGGWLGRLYVLPGLAVPYNIYIYHLFPTVKRRIILLTLLEIGFMVSPRRALLIQTLMVSIFMIIWRNKKRVKMKLQYVLIGVMLVLFFFGITQLLLNKSIGTGLRGGLKDIYLYIAGNISALGLLWEPIHPTGGKLTFNVIQRVLYSIGLITEEPSLSMDFVMVPLPFNTIPYFYYHLQDFGLAGTLLFVWCLAFIITFIYYRFWQSPGFINIFIYSYLITFLIFSFRENTLITYNTWYYFLLIIILRSFIRQPSFATRGVEIHA